MTKLYRLSTTRWTLHRLVYLIGGAFVAASAALGLTVHQGFFYFTLFVGLMFMNFALTGICPLAMILHRCGARE